MNKEEMQKIRNWAERVRSRFNKGLLTRAEIAKFEDVGFVFDEDESIIRSIFYDDVEVFEMVSKIY